MPPTFTFLKTYVSLLYSLEDPCLPSSLCWRPMSPIFALLKAHAFNTFLVVSLPCPPHGAMVTPIGHYDATILLSPLSSLFWKYMLHILSLLKTYVSHLHSLKDLPLSSLLSWRPMSPIFNLLKTYAPIFTILKTYVSHLHALENLCLPPSLSWWHMSSIFLILVSHIYYPKDLCFPSSHSWKPLLLIFTLYEFNTFLVVSLYLSPTGCNGNTLWPLWCHYPARLCPLSSLSWGSMPPIFALLKTYDSHLHSLKNLRLPYLLFWKTCTFHFHSLEDPFIQHISGCVGRPIPHRAHWLRKLATMYLCRLPLFSLKIYSTHLRSPEYPHIQHTSSCVCLVSHRLQWLCPLATMMPLSWKE